MIKSIVIKVFRLTDITDRILKAKKSQKKMDDEHWQEKLADEIHKIQLIKAKLSYLYTLGKL